MELQTPRIFSPEPARTGPQAGAEDKLWQRLLVISAEDIGAGDPDKACDARDISAPSVAYETPPSLFERRWGWGVTARPRWRDR